MDAAYRAFVESEAARDAALWAIIRAHENDTSVNVRAACKDACKDALEKRARHTDIRDGKGK